MKRAILIGVVLTVAGCGPLSEQKIRQSAWRCSQQGQVLQSATRRGPFMRPRVVCRPPQTPEDQTELARVVAAGPVG